MSRLLSPDAPAAHRADPDRLALTVATLTMAQRRCLACVCNARDPLRFDQVKRRTSLPLGTVKSCMAVLRGLQLVGRSSSKRIGRKGSAPIYHYAISGVSDLSQHLAARPLGGGRQPRAEHGFLVLDAVKDLAFRRQPVTIRAVADKTKLPLGNVHRWFRWLKEWGFWPIQEAA